MNFKLKSQLSRKIILTSFFLSGMIFNVLGSVYTVLNPDSCSQIGYYVDEIKYQGEAPTLKEIITQKNKYQYVNLGNNHLNYGFNDSIHWYTFSVYNNSTNKDFCFVPKGESVNCFVFYKLVNGKWVSQKLGNRVKANNKTFKSRFQAFEVSIVPNDTATFYFKAKTMDNLSFSPNFMTVEQFISFNISESAPNFTLYGIMLVIILYHVVYFFFFKDIAIVSYVLFVIGMLFYLLSHNGYFSMLFTPSMDHAGLKAGFIFIQVVIFMDLYFLKVLFNTKERFKKFNKVIKIVMVISGIMLPICLFHLSTAFTKLVILEVLLTQGVIMSLIVTAIVKKIREAKFIAIGKGLFYITIFLYLAILFGLDAQNIPTGFSLETGLVIDTIFMSISLVDRFNVLRLEKTQDMNKIIEEEDLSLQMEQEFSGSFARFVPNEFLSILDKKTVGMVNKGDSESLKCSFFVLDIRSFTSIAEQMPANELLNTLNKFYSYLGPIVRENGGFIHRYYGDGFLAIFPNSSDDALNAACSICNYVENEAPQEFSNIEEGLNVGIGVHHGDIIFGVVGENERLGATIISNEIDTAEQLQSACKAQKSNILISDKLKNSLRKIKEFRIESINPESYAVIGKY